MITHIRADVRLVKVDASDPKAVAQTKALIRLLYTVHETSRKSPLHQVRSNVRFHELETALAHCWRGLALPDDDAGRDHLHIAACHIWHLRKKCGPIVAITAWAAQWAPWCGRGELGVLINRVEADPRKWSADELAHELGLHVMSFAVRQALGLTTIGSIDVDKAARNRRRAANKKESSTARRRRNGAVSRSDYLAANVASQTKPWVALGESRATYYRRKARKIQDETSPNTPKKGNQLLYTDLSHHVVEQPAESGAPQAPRRRPPVAVHSEVLEGIIVDSGVAWAPPPTSHLARAIARARVLQAGVR
jgi:hypothetical protein